MPFFFGSLETGRNDREAVRHYFGQRLRRVTQARTPARRGKQSIKDCVILETYLEHIQLLRNAGRNAPAIFVSSNTQDYASENRTTIKDDIKSEFQALNLRFAPNMGAARGILGI